MKAAVVTSFQSPLQIQELPIPEPGPGQVLVRLEFSGLCHPDIHAANGDWPAKPVPPFMPGHRVIIDDRKLDESIADVVGGRVAARVVFQL